jgi:RNA polymerase-binding transcription factor DksA
MAAAKNTTSQKKVAGRASAGAGSSAAKNTTATKTTATTTSRKSPAKKATSPAKKAPSSKTTAATKSTATKSTATKTPAKKTPAKKTPAKKTAAKKTAAKKVPAKNTPVKKTVTNKTASRKTVTKKAAAKTTSTKKTVTKTTVKKSEAATKAAAEKAPAKKMPAKKVHAKKPGLGTPSMLSNDRPERHEIPKPRGTSKDGVSYTKDFDVKFLKAQRDELRSRRAGELARATRLEDEATSLIEDGEMGDVQFDDEGGEGDTMVVQRDLDRVLSSQARQTIGDIDDALARIEDGKYGYSDVSGRPIPRERLEAIPETTVLAAEKVSGIGGR